MPNKLARREVFQPLAALSLAALAPGALVGVGACSKSAQCNEAPGLSPDELKAREETAQYQDQSMEATKHCPQCALYVAPAQAGCGACQVVKGPINPNGYCKLYVGKVNQ
ncbi:MAG: high-potential iron-sulfur protein [Polyangiaceae bacterium]